MRVNDVLTVAYRADPSESLSPIPCKVTALSDDEMSFAMRAWLPFVPGWMLVPEKVHKVTRVSEEECLYQVYETQSGVLAYAVRYWMGVKQSAMNRGIADALKLHVERSKDVI